MTTRVMKTAQSLLGHLGLTEAGPRRVGTIKAHEGLLLEAAGFPMPLGTGVSISTADSSTVRGEVVGFRDQAARILPFANDQAFVNGGRVEPLGGAEMVPCGPALLGRVIDANGEPLDGAGPIVSRLTWPLTGKHKNPLDCGRVVESFDTGIRAIDALLTMGVGQRMAIVAGSGVGKSVLMGEILAGADCDICVVALVGERSREVSDFLETKLNKSRERSVTVAVPADHPPLLRLRAAMRATAIAEHFRSEGKRVLLLVDSLTRVAHAQREIGLSLGEPPTMKGYPPSALAAIPRLVERAGCDRKTGGSITALYTVLADGGDLEDPIVDSARAITDGHMILSRKIAEQGVYPAIDIPKSLSRTMPDVVDDNHLTTAARFRQLSSYYDDNQDLIMMGAYAAGNDQTLDEAIERREAMLGFIRQKAGERETLASAKEALFAEFAA